MNLENFVSQLTENLFDEAFLDLQKIKKNDGKNIGDDDAIKALANKEKTGVTRWLYQYNVVRTVSGKTRNQAITHLEKSNNFLASQDNICEKNIAEIISEVENLSSIITKWENESNKEKKKKTKVNHRISISSKLLWLKYSNIIPIYDRNAKNTLSMLLNCSDYKHSNINTGYAKFCRDWYEVYKFAEPVIREKIGKRKDAIGYSKVRIFDKILYCAGKPRY